MRRPLAVLALIAAVLSGAMPAAAQRGSGTQFKADNVRHDRALGLVVASGNVQVTRDDRVLLADTVTYNQRADTVTASGNISLTEPSGEVIFAEHVELSGDFKNGIVRAIRIRLTDDSRIAGAVGRRTDGVRTEMRKAVYSPCKPCKDRPNATPLWQIKAYRVVHDEALQKIEYNDAFLEFFGIPVLYTPYLAHPDPTVKRMTGFLAPSYGGDSQLGTVVRMPFYMALSPTLDATVTPIYTGNEGFVGAAEIRNRFNGGEAVATGSFTEDSTGQQRGHFDGMLRADLSDTWRGGLDAEYTTDDTYLKRYGFPFSETLVSRVYGERFRGRNYGAINTYYFQGLRATDRKGETPVIHPQIEYNYASEPGDWGGFWSLDWNLLALTRSEGTDSRRISLTSGWNLPVITEGGSLYTFFTSLQTDGYWVADYADPENPGGPDNGTTARAIPMAGIDWRLPFGRTGERFSQLIEPRVGFVAAPNSIRNQLIPNEDSTDFELDDTNVSARNRFTGVDRVEPGQRIYYGIGAGVYGRGGGSSSMFIGQSYRFRKDDTFALGSGLEDRHSDIIGRVQISPGPYLDLSYRFRIDKDELEPRRNEVSTVFGPKEFRISSTYIFASQAGSAEFDDREELFAGLTSQMSEAWSLAASTRRDLTTDGGTLNHSIKLQYLDDCIGVSTIFTRSFTRDRDVQPADSFMVRLELRSLGSVSAAASP